MILITQITQTSKECHRPAVLEIMLYLIVIPLTEHLDDELVQRVIITLPHFKRIPGIAPFHFPLQTHLFGLLAEGILLGCIFHLEQQPLLLKCLD